MSHRDRGDDCEENEDFDDFFDTPTAEVSPKKFTKSPKRNDKKDNTYTEPNADEHTSHSNEHKRVRPKSAHVKGRDSDSDNSTGRNRRKIEAKVPTSKSGTHSDSYDSSNDSDSSYTSSSSPEPTPRKSPRRGKDGKHSKNRDEHKKDKTLNAWSDERTHSSEEKNTHQLYSPKHQKDVRRKGSRSKSHEPEMKGYTDSESETESTSSYTDSDVTDVSPLASPVTKSSRHRELSDFARSGKPPKSPMTKDGTSSRSRPRSASSAAESSSRLLKPNSDSMDFRLLMAAVLEMDKDKDGGLDHYTGRDGQRKQFVVPPPGGSKLTNRKNFSFQNEKVNDIERENQRLMQEILRQALAVKKQKAKARAKAQQQAAQERLTTSAINRRKQQQKIDQENLAMLKRLQGARATKSVAREQLLHDYSKKTLFGVNIESAHPPRGTVKKSPYEWAQLSRVRSANSVRSESASVVSGMTAASPKSIGPIGSQTSTIKAPGVKKRRPLSATSAVSAMSSASTTKRTGKNARPNWEPGW